MCHTGLQKRVGFHVNSYLKYFSVWSQKQLVLSNRTASTGEDCSMCLTFKEPSKIAADNTFIFLFQSFKESKA